MKFYTSVEQSGNNIFVRGYQDGRAFEDKVKFNPTLYLPSQKPTDWKTLDGKYVRPVRQGTIKDARNFIEEHKEIPDFRFVVKPASLISIFLMNILMKK